MEVVWVVNVELGCTGEEVCGMWVAKKDAEVSVVG